MMNVYAGRLKELANVVLLVVMCGAVYSHIALGDTLPNTTPALVCGLVLLVRFAVVRLVHTQELKERTRADSGKKTQ